MTQPVDSQPLADYLVITGFFVVMLGVGFHFASRMRDLKDYFGAGKQVPWWLSGISYYMTTFSASSFVSYSALAYRYGWLPVTMWWMIACTMFLIARWIAARWRRVATTSPMEFLEERYSSGLRQGLSWLGSIYIIIDDGLKIFAIGTLVSVSLDLPAIPGLTPLETAVICCGTIMLAYTFLGGLWAVLVTDFVQFIVLLAAVLVLFPLAMDAAGGLVHFFSQAPDGFFSATGGNYTWTYLALFIMLMFLDNSTRWSLAQRFYSVRSDADSRRVCFLVAGLQFVGPPIMYFPAMAAAIFLPSVENADQIYSLVCRELLPVGLLGMMIAAMFSATMSMLSSDYNAVAAVLTTDVYKRWFARASSDRTYLLAGRILTLVVGAIAIGIALLVTRYARSKSLFDMVVTVFATITPPLTLPVLAGLMSRRVSNAGAIAGAVTGISIGLVARFLPDIIRLIDPLILAVTNHHVMLDEVPDTALMATGIISTLAGMIAGSIIAPGSTEKREKVARFLDGLEAREVLQEAVDSSDTTRISPTPIIGTAVTALGALLLLVVLWTTPLRDASLSLFVGGGMTGLGLLLVVLPRIPATEKR